MERRIFVGRQPILDRRGVKVGHELLFRDPASIPANMLDGFARSAAVLERVLGEFGLEQVLGSGDGFLNCTEEFLYSAVIDLIPASRFVLEVLEDAALTPELGARCDVLRQAGFRIALDDVHSMTPEIQRFLPHVDIVKLDWPFLVPGDIASLVAICKCAGATVLAEKIEERSDHAAAMRAGCDLFQGFYFARPQVLVSSRFPSSFGPVLRILRLLIEEASDVKVELALRSAPSMVVQLLRLANSGAYLHQRNKPITSVRQALSCVGTRQLMRWCCLFLYSNPASPPLEIDPLVQLITRRATFMERAATALTPDDSNLPQSAWLSGLLSLAHVPNALDVNTFMTAMPVDMAIQQAVTKYEGVLGKLLSIAERLEQGRFDEAFERGCALDQDFALKLPKLVL
ncbi:EAL and HDOD domain-containing protein [Paraburkholderia caledonica]|uniref:EAL and modified HD-GYP domain-containing signal transduction protein n=1 Tax=Paraburkholderia caledonica TaxID=134536 RepID=A0AB73IP49_9BURK|nr:EAL and modified HD-GYP domain-containing signal transduction protein [Paraburkholderia caledonica]